jgi:hypothetical protein
MSGAGAPLRLLGVNLEKHARIHRCDTCGAYWDESERYAQQVSEQQAQALLAGATGA